MTFKRRKADQPSSVAQKLGALLILALGGLYVWRVADPKWEIVAIAVAGAILLAYPRSFWMADRAIRGLRPPGK